MEMVLMFNYYGILLLMNVLCDFCFQNFFFENYKIMKKMLYVIYIYFKLGYDYKWI